jgi:hypothetical protein
VERDDLVDGLWNSSKFWSSPKPKNPRPSTDSFFQYAVLYVKARGGTAARVEVEHVAVEVIGVAVVHAEDVVEEGPVVVAGPPGAYAAGFVESSPA